MENEESHFIQHAPCPSCNSGDALAVFSDGHTHCFSCHAHTSKAGATPKKRVVEGLETGEHQALTKRRLSEETCRKWGYAVGTVDGNLAQIATYRSQTGVAVAQKVRFANKKFKWLGDPKQAGLYGQHLWRDGGKMLVITEGEIDALTVSQLQNNKWPVVSVPNGAQGAAKSIAKEIEWVEKFDRVVLMFDNDEHGIAAAEEVATLLSPGKAHIATLPLKDANECLVNDQGAAVIDAMWGAKQWRPDEIVPGIDLWDRILRSALVAKTVPYPWAQLNDMTHGMRMGEVLTLAAGTGLGKSTVCRELTHWLLSKGETVGSIALEESVERTAIGVMSVEVNKPLHLGANVDYGAYREAYEKTVGCGRFYTYDHFGSLDSENLYQRIRYMVVGCGCQWIILDHLSIVVSGIGEGDERRLIDNAMTTLRSMVEELGFGLILVSHLKDNGEKTPLEEGGQTHLNLLRGSRAIGQLSDMVLGFERNQQDPETSHLMTIRVLKNRFSGETGEAQTLTYDRKTGRLEALGSNPFAAVEADGEEDSPF